MVNKLYESAKGAHQKFSTYTFRPAGCKPPPKQRDCTQPNNALEKAYKEYMKFFKDGMGSSLSIEIPYNKARDLIKDIRPNPNEIHALLLAYQNNPNIKYAGLFVSAVYNLSTDHEIIYDLDIPVDCLGFELPKDKTFINRGTAGKFMGEFAEGIVINYGTAGGSMGSYAKGSVINYGTAGGWMGLDAKGLVINYGTTHWCMGHSAEGLVINYGTASSEMGHKAKGLIIALKNPESFGDISKAEQVLKEDKCKQMPELIEYFDNLKNILNAGKKNYCALHAIPSAEQMEADIRKILKKAGW